MSGTTTLEEYCMILEKFDSQMGVLVAQRLTIVALINDLRVATFRDQHDAPPEHEWDDELKMMFAIQFPEDVARS